MPGAYHSAARCEASCFAAFFRLLTATGCTIVIHEYILYFTYLLGSKETKPWNYSPKALRKATCGFVGLLNLGATCYMNSVLQQIFMVPQFRKGLLSCEVENQGVGDENTQILYQLQRIFSYLQVCGLRGVMHIKSGGER